MAEGRARRIEIGWGTIVKLLAAVAVIWLWMHLWRLVMIFIVAAMLAIALAPLVRRLERGGWRRGWAATLVTASLVILLAGFLVATWASLSRQAGMLAGRFVELRQTAENTLPQPLIRMIGIGGQGQRGEQRRAESGGEGRQQSGAARSGEAGQGGAQTDGFARAVAGPLLRSAGAAVWAITIGLILTFYLLLEGKLVHEWVVAFFPERLRRKAYRTSTEMHEAIEAYVVGNVVTSAIAAVVTFIVLWLLDVPAALLLALLAGITDFIPIIGFVIGAIPAVLLAMMVSPATAIAVAAFYVIYNAVETYFIAPRVYGNRLRLSNVAVLLAFAAGAELGGAVGALLALPFAAAYPAFERIWLREKLGEEVVERHAQLEERGA